MIGVLQPYKDFTEVRQELFLHFLRLGDDLSTAAGKAERGLNFIQHGALLTNQDLMDLGRIKPEAP